MIATLLCAQLTAHPLLKVVVAALTRFLSAEGSAEPRLDARTTIRRIEKRFKHKSNTKSAVYRANSGKK
jgi:hypothetical protein